MSSLKIVDYQEHHQREFERLNRAWIEEWFEMEPLDVWVLTRPDEAILAPGGAILMAEYDGNTVGAAGLRKVTPGVFEFTKMAVVSNYRRKGIAQSLCYACFRKAAELGAQKVILYSNTMNAGAILMYEKIGFQHLPVEPGVYKRANVKMEIDISSALQKADAYYSLIKT